MPYKCSVDGCRVSASFSVGSNPPTRCGNHAEKGMLNQCHCSRLRRNESVSRMLDQDPFRDDADIVREVSTAVWESHAYPDTYLPPLYELLVRHGRPDLVDILYETPFQTARKALPPPLPSPGEDDEEFWFPRTELESALEHWSEFEQQWGWNDEDADPETPEKAVCEELRRLGPVVPVGRFRTQLRWLLAKAASYFRMDVIKAAYQTWPKKLLPPLGWFVYVSDYKRRCLAEAIGVNLPDY